MNKDKILPEDCYSGSFEKYLQSVLTFIQFREFEVLISCDYNMTQPTGYDILTSLLKMSNSDYNFRDFLAVVHTLSIRHILSGQYRHQLAKPRVCQSTIYYCFLKALTIYLNWNVFYDDF
jgi:hypothetical protein